MRHKQIPKLALAALILWPGALVAEVPEILDVVVEKQGMDWQVHVTISHPDSGWDHYANGWEVLDAEGNRIGYRELLHPHVNEQPFTRSLRNVMVPDGMREIYVRAHCSDGSWSGEPVAVRVPF